MLERGATRTEGLSNANIIDFARFCRNALSPPGLPKHEHALTPPLVAHSASGSNTDALKGSGELWYTLNDSAQDSQNIRDIRL
jgi:hypothetical protein